MAGKGIACTLKPTLRVTKKLISRDFKEIISSCLLQYIIQWDYCKVIFHDNFIFYDH